jgi:hypothetical protein
VALLSGNLGGIVNGRNVAVAALAAVMTTGAWTSPGEPAHHPVRFATFNASLNRATEGELLADLFTPDDPQARDVAEVVQRSRPDVVLLNEFDYVEGNAAIDASGATTLPRASAVPRRSTTPTPTPLR